MAYTRDEQDTKLEIYIPQVINEQAAYFSEHGEYQRIPNYNGELDIHVDSSTSGGGVFGFVVRAYAREGEAEYVRMVDSLGTQSTPGWIRTNLEE